ncbi:MAG: ATP-binding protein [Burkholderiales bacterium]|nr:ATP-binding protein [Burkholderiales bacterium]
MKVASSAYSLKGRLLWLLLGAITVTAAIQSTIAYRTSLDEANEIFDYHMQQVALSLRGGLPASSIVEKFVHDGEEENFDLIIQVWATDGTPIFTSTARAELPRHATFGFSDLQIGDASYRVFALQMPNRVIQIAQESSARGELARSLALRTVLPVLLLAPLLALLVWWIVHQAFRPVVGAQQELSARRVDDLSPVSTTGLPNEIRPLVLELNLLFERLHKAFAAQQHFVADAAHELRSPLTALRLQAEAMLRVKEAADRQAAGGRLIAGIDRATRLVEQLLLLARQEAGGLAALRMGPVPLDSVVSLAVEDIIAQAHLAELDVGLVRSDAAEIAGSADSLRVLMRNLLENAIKFTPKGGRIDVSIVAEASQCTLLVEDSGPGISTANRARVFDRFFREGTVEVSGSGLGLSIVKTIADAHHATISLSSSARLGGLMVAVHFPAASSAAAQPIPS